MSSFRFIIAFCFAAIVLVTSAQLSMAEDIDIDSLPVITMENDDLQSIQEDVLAENAPSEASEAQISPETNSAAKSPYADYPQELLDNSQIVYNKCQSHSFEALHYDCKCRAISYLDEAINYPPGTSLNSVLSSLDNNCPNRVQMAGAAYTECTTKGVAMNIDKDAEEFCSCYAREYSRALASIKNQLSSAALIAARKHGIRSCR